MIAELCWYWDAYVASWSHVIGMGIVVLLVIWYGYCYTPAPARQYYGLLFGIYWTPQGWWFDTGFPGIMHGPYLTKELAQAAMDKYYDR